ERVVLIVGVQRARSEERRLVTSPEANACVGRKAFIAIERGLCRLRFRERREARHTESERVFSGVAAGAAVREHGGGERTQLKTHEVAAELGFEMRRVRVLHRQADGS